MSAPVWEYFSKLSSETSSDSRAKCKKCGTIVNNSKGSTAAMINHMRNVHKVCVKRKEVNTNSNDNLHQKTITQFINKPNLEEIVTELATKDGFSIRGITRSAFIRQSLAGRGLKLPKSENGTMALIHTQYEKIKIKYINIFDEATKNHQKYSITIDEWVSSRQRRYMNINVHDQTGNVYNLGLVRIIGSCTAETVLSIVSKHLETFHLSFKNDIVATTNDGASVMVKYGKDCPAEVQLCLNHAIHLAVSATFYSKQPTIDNNIQNSNSSNEIEFDSDEDIGDENEDLFLSNDPEEIYESPNLNEKLNKIRAIVKFFKYSTIRNDILQKKVVLELGKELQLILDVKHRWNSIYPMLDTFLKIKKPISDALEELNAVHLIHDINFQAVKELCSIMEPILVTVRALSRKDANLITARGAVNFLIKKLDEISITNFAEINDLKNNIKMQLRQRQNTQVDSLLHYILQQQIPKKEILDFGTTLLKRLFPLLDDNKDTFDVIVTNTQASLDEEINASIRDAANIEVEKPFSSLREDFVILKKTGNKTKMLQKLYDAILTIRPTSTEAERVFSISANFSRKLRSRLSDNSLNCLVFLKYYHQNMLE